MTTDYSEFGWSDAQPAFYHELLCKYIERLLPADGSPILDVGCGNGFTANYLAGKGSFSPFWNSFSNMRTIRLLSNKSHSK